jgi:hypothetical protein
MDVKALVSANRPIIRICDLDHGGDECAEIEFETQAVANAAVEKLNEIFKKATRIEFKPPGTA